MYKTVLLLIFTTFYCGTNTALALPSPQDRGPESGIRSDYAGGSELAAAEPDYAKWGNMAIRQASRKYTVLDYKYIGLRQISPNEAERSFTFWVRKDGREFGLDATVIYNPKTKEVYDIRFQEHDRP